MARKLYGSARAVSNIGSLQVGTSSYPAVSAVNKATFISKINSIKSIRDMIIAGDNITGAALEIVNNSNDTWNGSVAVNFGGTIVKSGPSSTTLSAATAFIESCGGTVIAPVTRSLYSPLTLTDITYGNGTRQIKKLYGAVSEPVYQAEQPTLIEDNGAGQFINQSQFDLDKLGAYFKSINCQTGVAYRMTLWGSGSAGLWIGDPNSQTMDMKNSITVEELATLGISATTGLYTASGNVSFRVRIHQNGTATFSREIKKLYGSAEVPAYVSSQPQMTADQGMGQYIDQSAFNLNKLGDAIAAGGGQQGTYYHMNIWYVTSQGGFGIWVGNPGNIIMQTGLSRAALAEYGVTTNAVPPSDAGNAEFRVSIQQNGTKSVTKLLLDNS